MTQTDINAVVHHKWKVGMNYWCQHLMFLWVSIALERLTLATDLTLRNDRCPDICIHFLFIRWDYHFLHLMHSRYKDKQVLNHKLNSSISLILLPISKCPHPPKKATLCSPVSHSDRSFYSNLILAEWHKPRSEYFHVLTDTHFPFKQIALFLL